MQVIDLQFEVAQVSIAEGLAFYDFDLVVDALHLGVGDAEVEVVEDTVGMTAQLPGEASQERDPRGQCGRDPVMKMLLGLFERRQSPEMPEVLLEHIGDHQGLVHAQ